jgi:hypothetical protein
MKKNLIIRLQIHRNRNNAAGDVDDWLDEAEADAGDEDLY